METTNINSSACPSFQNQLDIPHNISDWVTFVKPVCRNLHPTQVTIENNKYQCNNTDNQSEEKRISDETAKEKKHLFSTEMDVHEINCIEPILEISPELNHFYEERAVDNLDKSLMEEQQLSQVNDEYLTAINQKTSNSKRLAMKRTANSLNLLYDKNNNNVQSSQYACEERDTEIIGLRRSKRIKNKITNLDSNSNLNVRRSKKPSFKKETKRYKPHSTNVRKRTNKIKKVNKKNASHGYLKYSDLDNLKRTRKVKKELYILEPIYLHDYNLRPLYSRLLRYPVILKKLR